MSTVRDIVDSIGRQRLCESLDVGMTAVSNAVRRGVFPPSWYVMVCELAGTSLPPHLFNMRSAPTGDATSPAQPAGQEYRTNGAGS